MAVTIYMKEDVNRRFVSVYFVSKRFKSGSKSVFIPQGKHNEGWIGLKNCFPALFEERSFKYQIQIQQTKSQDLGLSSDYKGTLLGQNSTEISMGEFMVSVETGNADWKLVPDIITQMLYLSQCITCNLVGESLMIAVHSSKDHQVLSCCLFLVTQDGVLRIDKANFIPPVWLKEEMWIKIIGPRLSDQSLTYMSSSLEKYGKVKVYRTCEVGYEACLSDCQVLKLPHVMKIQDNGIPQYFRIFVMYGDVEIRRTKEMAESDRRETTGDTNKLLGRDNTFPNHFQRTPGVPSISD